MEMPPLYFQKALKKFPGKVSYLRWFISTLAKIVFPFRVLLKGNHKFEWFPKHNQAFEAIKKALTSPHTMIVPQPGKLLLLHPTSPPRFISALLVQNIDGAEKPVYYINRIINDVELRYAPIERH